MATSAMEMANRAVEGSGRDMDEPMAEIPRGGLTMPTTAYIGKGNSAQQTTITVESAVQSRVVRLSLAGIHYDDIMAADDPDTGVITLRVACQSHPIARWRRIAPRLIRSQFGESEVPRMLAALETVIARVEAEFAK